jgi:hypothetical protein
MLHINDYNSEGSYPTDKKLEKYIMLCVSKYIRNN